MTQIFEKMNKIDKPLSKLNKRHRENIQNNKIINEKGDIITDTEEIQRINKDKFLKPVLHQLEKI